jgi:signal transduction histidine kinase
MPVEIGHILHVLAHELRTPVGIAHGYVRLLLEDRLPQESDRRRAMEQIQKALARLSELSKESSALAALSERTDAIRGAVPARALLERVAAADYQWAVTVDATNVTDDVMVRTPDEAELAAAIVSLVRATARETRSGACHVVIDVDDEAHLEVLVAPPEDLEQLRTAAARGEATPVALERGGLGLALVHAAIVLEDHGADCWTCNGSRAMLGFRLPLNERPHA